VAAVTESPVPRPFVELSESGLLWLINRVVFYPRGFALGLAVNKAGEVTGWRLAGDGSRPLQMEGDEPEFERAEEAFAAARADPVPQ
jgi:hypothetical protein